MFQEYQYSDQKNLCIRKWTGDAAKITLVFFIIGLLITIYSYIKNQLSMKSKKTNWGAESQYKLYQSLFSIYFVRILKQIVNMIYPSDFDDDIQIRDLIRVMIQDLGFVLYFQMIAVLTLMWFDLYKKIIQFQGVLYHEEITIFDLEYYHKYLIRTVYTAYFLKFILLTIKFLYFDMTGDDITLAKFLMSLMTILPCSLLLVYYGYYISKVIKSKEFKLFCFLIVFFSLFRTVMYGLQYFLKTFSGISIQNYMADLCDENPDPDNCGFCVYEILDAQVYYTLGETIPNILILYIIQPSSGRNQVNGQQPFQNDQRNDSYLSSDVHDVGRKTSELSNIMKSGPFRKNSTKNTGGKKSDTVISSSSQLHSFNSYM